MKKDISFIWETCLKFLYDGSYLDSLEKFLKKNNLKKILDCSCGTGFPSIELKKRGFNIFCSDGSQTMLKRFYLNCIKEGVRIESKRLYWNELNKNFGEEFDLVFCRGNSLPYVVSWETPRFSIKKARAEVSNAIKAFYSVLKPNGLFYIDLAPREALKPKKTDFIEDYGKRNLNGKEMGLKLTIRHDLVRKIRVWEPELAFYRKDKIIERFHASFRGYHLNHSTLIKFLTETGFKQISPYKELRGEKNYDVFIARK